MYLNTIIDQRRADVEASRAAHPLDEPPPIREPGRFFDALSRPGIGLICEIKRRSPSKGPLAEIPDPGALARRYQEGGARAISVLTESRHFGGGPDDLKAVRAAVDIPVLRKDFIVDVYQVHEAALWQADAYLLIAAVLDDATLGNLVTRGRALGMEPLVEVHDQEELDRALATDARVIGINNRDLKSFEVSLQRTLDLIPGIPAGRLMIAESGYSDRAAIETVERAGAHGVLIGEALVTSADPAARIRQLSGQS